ncbi:hypothetical protein N7448_001925 [Penicillium atrosanguineum]|uniref:Uncharacterized protein n=1 Tax=Penicillium atrosanguineum TaxID=1132637 RepID=A0A9W9PUY8_9EURO|nr:hypothetical protein N7448_001925 [Penicillium atrosanguineum]KAJ5310964.1 hypothetical protein N7476_006824 [Penicillium atrosanguineum]
MLALYSLGILALVDFVHAKSKFPYPLSEAHAQLKTDDGVTFDPLGVAAVLYNPRADKSAARLYTQYDRNLFTWPHMTMIGGTLPPMQMLVERLTATFKWIHPAIKMCAKDTTMLPVRSDVSENVFRQLPLNLSNIWLSDVISFQTSKQPGNDFAIVWVDTVHKSGDDGEGHVRAQVGNIWWWRTGKWALDLMCLLNGAMLVAAMVCGILVADIWAFTLFLLYSCHWVASVFISFTAMVEIHKPEIRNDSIDRYAVYEREEGGTVIFKGPQKKLEEWARSTWEYNQTWGKDCLHWFWILTGTMSGIASVACMVNMYGYMQLAFLGVLVYSSLAEIGATRIARILQTKAHGTIFKAEILDNKTRTRAIIRATLEVIPKCRLTKLNWIKMGLLPPMQVFQAMQDLLEDISQMQEDVGKMQEDGSFTSAAQKSHNLAIELRCAEFVDQVRLEDPERILLAERIRDEVLGTLHPN